MESEKRNRDGEKKSGTEMEGRKAEWKYRAEMERKKQNGNGEWKSRMEMQKEKQIRK